MHVQTLASQAIGAVYSVYIVTLSAVPIRFFYSGFTMPIPLPRHATPKVFIFFQGERVITDPLVAEANIVFGLHAHATSLVTIAKLRKHFSKSESRAVAHKVFVYNRNKVILIGYSTVVTLQHILVFYRKSSFELVQLSSINKVSFV